MGGLKDYFEEVKKIKLTESQKMKIYEEILGKQYRCNFFYKAKFYLKILSYTFIILILILSFFPFIDLEKDQNYVIKKITFITGGIYTEKDTKCFNRYKFDRYKLISNKVFADWVGQIISVRGNFSIVRNNIIVKTNEILSGDSLIIDKKTYLEFEIGSGYIGKIVGPAKVRIAKNSKQGYVLNLVWGQYFEIKKNKNIDLNIKVVTDNIEIIPKDRERKDVNFKVMNKGNKKIVENKGKTPLIVEKVKSKSKVVLIENQAVQINGDIRLLVKMIRNGKIEKKYVFSSDTVFAREKKVNLNKEILEDYKVVPTEIQLVKLSQILYPSFLKKDVLNLVNSWQDDEKKKIAINNLMYRILQIYKLFDVNIDSEILKTKVKVKSFDIDDLFLLIDQLVAKLNQKYYIEPKYIFRLKQLEAWILVMKSKRIKLTSYSSLEKVFRENKSIEKYKDKLKF